MNEIQYTPTAHRTAGGQIPTAQHHSKLGEVFDEIERQLNALEQCVVAHGDRLICITVQVNDTVTNAPQPQPPSPPEAPLVLSLMFCAQRLHNVRERLQQIDESMCL